MSSAQSEMGSISSVGSLTQASKIDSATAALMTEAAEVEGVNVFGGRLGSLDEVGRGRGLG